MMKETIYYHDVDNVKLIERRKKDLKVGRLSLIVILGSYSFVAVLSLFRVSDNENLIALFLLWIVTLIGGFFALNYVYVRDEKFAVVNGIKLTSKELRIYSYVYPISSILYSEVVNFADSGNFMAIVYLKKGKKKVKLLRKDETEDILKLSNLIRKIKGLPEQKEIKKYGSYRGYYTWKKEIRKKLNRNNTVIK